jgi:hypothetical protein
VGVCECGGQKMKECKALVHVCEDVRSTSGVCVLTEYVRLLFDFVCVCLAVCLSVCLSVYIYAQPLVCLSV